MTVLPVNADFGHFEFEFDIADETYTFAVHWNDRAEGWFLTLKDSTGAILVGSKRLCLNQALFISHRYALVFAEDIVPIDFSGTEREMSYGDLGDRVKLFLGTYDELSSG